MTRTAALALTIVALAAAGSAVATASKQQPVRIAAFVDGEPPNALDEAIDNVECMLNIKTLARYHKDGLRGFAARLSATQINRLARTRVFRPALRGRGSFLLHVAAPDRDAVEARVAALEQRLGFSVDVGFDRDFFRGFGAVLDWRQLARIDSEVGVTVTPDPFPYTVWFQGTTGQAAVERTAELEQRYGFRATSVLEDFGGFSAPLTKRQLAGLSTEPDLFTYTFSDGSRLLAPEAQPPVVECLRASARDRRALARAFSAARPGRNAERTVGRVYLGRLTTRDDLAVARRREYALARFRAPRGGRAARLELFTRKPGGRWRDLGRVGRRICIATVPEPVLAMWLLRRLSTRCFAPPGSAA